MTEPTWLDGDTIASGTTYEASLLAAGISIAAVERGARVLCASHLGKPGGKIQSALSLAPVAVELAKQLGQPVRFVDDCVGSEVEKIAAELAAMLAQKPGAGNGEFHLAARDMIAGNLCRCTGYQNIVKSVLWAAEKLRAEA